MKIKRGTYRTTVLIGPLAIKFPRIKLKNGLMCLKHEIRHPKLFQFYKDTVLFSGTSKTALFGGIICNWQERSFYRRTKLPILIPTYFSLFGLINIQKAGHRPIGIDHINLWCQLYDITNGEVFDDSHTFSNPENFCRENDRLVIIDYCRKTQRVLCKYGKKIQEEFDFSYSQENKKEAE